ncbi:DUF6503 family protein [Aquimarina sp. AU474]|uniref:DUF6503 family protein n=1 Tax=Aquimarina sp. AU474 TaxID=2108529 RepID=UPI00135A48D6|nr:DUF6503 family protein [Aquimarina sp. AU474]
MKKLINFYNNTMLEIMKKITFYITIVLGINSVIAQQIDTKNSPVAKGLIHKVVAKTGNYDLLKKLKDVAFEYTFYSTKTNKKDVSTERYIFDGEVSWGNYKTHQYFVFPNTTETVTQFYDGSTQTNVTLGDKNITDLKVLKSANFLRKANFYWFTMMPKLLDQGIVYELLPNRTHNRINYKIVKIGFNKGVGEVQDEFILYINPKTFLIDRFLFTVKGFIPGVLLMEAEYKTVNGYTFMAKRKVISGAQWDGSITGDVLFEQTSTNVKFTNGFTKEILSNIQ